MDRRRHLTLSSGCHLVRTPLNTHVKGLYKVFPGVVKGIIPVNIPATPAAKYQWQSP